MYDSEGGNAREQYKVEWEGKGGSKTGQRGGEWERAVEDGLERN